MSYSCSDFTDDILSALEIDVPEDACDSPSVQADLALGAIERMQKALIAVTKQSDYVSFDADTRALVASAIIEGCQK